MKTPAFRQTAFACGGAFVLLLSVAMVEPSAASPSQCTTIVPDAQRLACFDREFPPQKPEATTDARQSWQSRSAPSLLPGHKNETASLSSAGEIQCRWMAPRPIRLDVQCKDNVTSISFETGCYMTSSEYRSYGNVTYRLDKNSPRIARMVAGRDNHSLGFWSGDAAIPYIRELLGKQRLEVKMTPYADESVAAVFDLRGMEDAIKPVRRECGW